MFQMAQDPDNANLYPGESRYDVCYFLICNAIIIPIKRILNQPHFLNAGGNSEYFNVADKTLNQLQTRKTLDHEQSLAIPYVLILATNDCTNKPVQSCSDIDATKGQYLNITIDVSVQQILLEKTIHFRALFVCQQVIDVNDCNPVFSGSLSGGITEGDSLNTRVFPMTVY